MQITPGCAQGGGAGGHRQAGEAGSRPLYVGDARQSAGVRRSLACPLWSRSPPLHDFDGGIFAITRGALLRRLFQTARERAFTPDTGNSRQAMQTTAHELRRAGVAIARTKEGFELPVNDVTHPRFVLPDDTESIRILRDATLLSERQRRRVPKLSATSILFSRFRMALSFYSRSLGPSRPCQGLNCVQK